MASEIPGFVHSPQFLWQWGESWGRRHRGDGRNCEVSRVQEGEMEVESVVKVGIVRMHVSLFAVVAVVVAVEDGQLATLQ